MSLSDFSHLIEVQSLDRQINILLNEIDEEKGRISFLEKQRLNKQNNFDQLKVSLQESKKILATREAELNSLSSKIDQNKAHAKNVSSQKQLESLEKEEAALSTEYEKLELVVLELMENIEANEEESKTLESFLSGSLETIQNITLEVESISKNKNLEIKYLDERIENLFSCIEKNILESFLQARKKHRFNNSLAFIQSGSCSICKMGLDQMLKSRVEHGEVPEFCPNCDRLLTPLSAKK